MTAPQIGRFLNHLPVDEPASWLADHTFLLCQVWDYSAILTKYDKDPSFLAAHYAAAFGSNSRFSNSDVIKSHLTPFAIFRRQGTAHFTLAEESMPSTTTYLASSQ